MVLIIAFCSVPFVMARRNGRIDLFEPSVVVCAVWLLAYVVPALAILAGTDIMWLTWGSRAGGYTPNLVARALTLSLIGLVSFLVAYYVPLPRRSVKAPIVSYVLNGQKFLFWSVLVAGGALALFGLFIVKVGGFVFLATNLNDRVRVFSGLNYLVMPVLALLSIVEIRG